jgi:glycosyltransferase involved in cell wall biosynthesis
LKIILLTRYFPPEISGGARRPSALVRAWRELGAQVTVVGPAGIEDEDCVQIPHPSFPAIPDLSASHGSVPASISDRMRRAILLPDPEVRWALRAARMARPVATNADWIVTTSPPESLHLAGRLLKQQTSCLWLADLRDLWLVDPQLAVRRHPFRRVVEEQLAKWILSGCDALTSVSPIVETEGLALAGSLKPSLIVPHFALPFEGTPEALPPETFNIVHTGSVGLSNPLSEFGCLIDDFEALALVKPMAVLWLAGNLVPAERARCLASPVGGRIRLLGPVSMTRARALQAGADALALVSGRYSHALPGKYSEYHSTGLPILISAPGPWRDLLPADGRTMPFGEGAALAKADTQARQLIHNRSYLDAGQAMLVQIQYQTGRIQNGR